jgi:hypothetical protein
MPRGCSFIELSNPIIIFNMEFPRADEELFIIIFYWKVTKILLKYIKIFLNKTINNNNGKPTQTF